MSQQGVFFRDQAQKDGFCLKKKKRNKKQIHYLFDSCALTTVTVSSFEKLGFFVCDLIHKPHFLCSTATMFLSAF